MRLRFLLSTTFLLAPLAGLHATPAAPKPNVVLILADDMGFSDPGGYGGEIATPRLPVYGFDAILNCRRKLTVLAIQFGQPLATAEVHVDSQLSFH